TRWPRDWSSDVCSSDLECFEAAAHIVRELAAIYVERSLARLRNDGEGERERRVRDVGAADVEGPSDGVRVRHDERVGAQLRQFGDRKSVVEGWGGEWGG